MDVSVCSYDDFIIKFALVASVLKSEILEREYEYEYEYEWQTKLAFLYCNNDQK